VTGFALTLRPAVMARVAVVIRLAAVTLRAALRPAVTRGVTGAVKTRALSSRTFRAVTLAAMAFKSFVIAAM
jgi:hypothetical protein